MAEEIDKIAAFFLSHADDSTDTSFYYHNFFIPFNEFAAKNVESKFPEAPQIRELAILTRDGKSVYEKLIKENEGLADEFKKLHDRLKPEIEQLKQYSNRLLQDFGA